MSQSTPSKQSSPSSEKASESRAPNVVTDQDVVLNVAPLNTVPPSDSARSQPRKMHARKSTGGSVPETFSVQGREGSSYVHNAIANIVTRILNEGHKVEGISVPLAQMPASDDDQGEQDDASKDQDNVETSVDKNDETPVAKDVVTSKDENPNVHDVVDLDDLDDPIDIADDDLISSISNRVKARKGKQVGEQHSLKPQVTPLKTVTKEKMKKVPTGPSKSGSRSADSGDDHATGSDGEKMDADSEDEYKAEDDEDADAQTSSSSDVEMSEEDDEDTAGSED
ncbi:ATP-dependent RNA helicase drs1-like [Vicia villosa]|uniref:ATP-dependent RNA helicase drs1-like n=1 Tax=Vicia villosa TaxID=3911 RepID=UPI00273AD27C|nr:ATP-dependent RNA helicase drs1-like [Vicia villosa]